MNGNTDRAERGQQLLVLYRRLADRPEDDSYFRQLVGAVGDLAQLAESLDLDWDQVLAEARWQYRSERLIQGEGEA
jgi:hypothetical protein